MHLCVRERVSEKGRDGEGGKKREKERGRKRGKEGRRERECVCVCMYGCTCMCSTLTICCIASIFSENITHTLGIKGEGVIVSFS